MAQKSEGSKFEAQMSIISSVISATPHEWLLIGGDRNRDIRTHGVAQSFIFRLGAWVLFVKNKVHLPKDFVVLKGLTGQPTASWSSPIGNHPVVWIKGVSSVQAGSTRSANHPVEPGKWSLAQKKLFPSLMEAFSKLSLSSAQWLEMYRECISVVSRRAPDQAEESTEQQKLAELAEMELVAQGHHWDVPERFRSRLVSSYWKSTVDQWKQVTGSGLTSTTMKVVCCLLSVVCFEVVCGFTVHGYA